MPITVKFLCAMSDRRFENLDRSAETFIKEWRDMVQKNRPYQIVQDGRIVLIHPSHVHSVEIYPEKNP